MNKLFYLLAGIPALVAMCISWYHITKFLQALQLPDILAFTGGGVFDVIAVVCAYITVTRAMRAEGNTVTKIVTWMFIVFSMVINIAWSVTQGNDLLAHVVYAAFPLSAGIVLELLLADFNRKALSVHKLAVIPTGFRAYWRFRDQVTALRDKATLARIRFAEDNLRGNIVEVTDNVTSVVTDNNLLDNIEVENKTTDAVTSQVTQEDVASNKTTGNIETVTHETIVEVTTEVPLEKVTLNTELPCYLVNIDPCSLANIARLLVENSDDTVDNLVNMATLLGIETTKGTAKTTLGRARKVKVG